MRRKHKFPLTKSSKQHQAAHTCFLAKAEYRARTTCSAVADLKALTSRCKVEQQLLYVSPEPHGQGSIDAPPKPPPGEVLFFFDFFFFVANSCVAEERAHVEAGTKAKELAISIGNKMRAIEHKPERDKNCILDPV